MQATIDETKPLERRINISVPVEEVSAAFNSRLQKFAKTVTLKGFRPGKVPLSHVQQVYGASLQQETMTELVQKNLDKALQENQLVPATRPMVDIQSFVVDQPLNYTVVFEILPQIDPILFENVTLEKVVSSVETADVDLVIKNLQKQHGTWHETDQPAETGDQIVLDFKGYIDGQAFQGGEGLDVPLLLGSKTMIPGFEDGLIGAKMGEERELKVMFPPDYRVNDLAGKEATFATTLKKVSKPNLAELNEAFIKKLGVKSCKVEDLKQEVKQNLERELDQNLKVTLKNQVLQELLKQNKFDVPEGLVLDEIKRMETMKQIPEQKEGDVAPGIKKIAQRNVALGLLTSACEKFLSIQLDKARVRHFIEQISAAYEDPEKTVKWYYSNAEQMMNIEYHILQEQVVEALLEKATLTEKKVPFQEAMNVNQMI